MNASFSLQTIETRRSIDHSSFHYVVHFHGRIVVLLSDLGLVDVSGARFSDAEISADRLSDGFGLRLLFRGSNMIMHVVYVLSMYIFSQ